MFFFKNNKRMWDIGTNAYFFPPDEGTVPVVVVEKTDDVMFQQ